MSSFAQIVGSNSNNKKKHWPRKTMTLPAEPTLPIRVAKKLSWFDITEEEEKAVQVATVTTTDQLCTAATAMHQSHSQIDGPEDEEEDGGAVISQLQKDEKTDTEEQQQSPIGDTTGNIEACRILDVQDEREEEEVPAPLEQHFQPIEEQVMQQQQQNIIGLKYNGSTILLTATTQCINLDSLKCAMLPNLSVSQFLQTLEHPCPFTVARDQHFAGRYLEAPRVIQYLVPYVSQYCSHPTSELLSMFIHIELIYPVQPYEFGLLRQELFKRKLINACVIELAEQIVDANALRGVRPVVTAYNCINQVYTALHARRYVAPPSVWFTVPPHIESSLDIVRSTLCNAIIGLFGYNRVHVMQQVHLASVYMFHKAMFLSVVDNNTKAISAFYQMS